MSQDSGYSGLLVEKTPPEGEVYDVMGGSGRWEVKIDEHGVVALLDVMPRFCPDQEDRRLCHRSGGPRVLRARHEAGQRGPRAHPLPGPPPAHDAVRDGGVQVPPRHADLRRPAVDPAPDGERERILGATRWSRTAFTALPSKACGSRVRRTDRAARGLRTSQRPKTFCASPGRD